MICLLDNFREEVAAKHNRTLSNILYVLAWAVMMMSALMAMMFLSSFTTGNFQLLPIILFAVFGGIAVLIWFKKDNLRIEYDYTFTNGDLDVGKVFGNARRKLMTSLPMKNVEACGLVTDPSFQRYITMNDVKKHNWFVNRGATLYYFYFVKNSVKHIIVLEISNDMALMLRPYLNYGVWQGEEPKKPA